MEKQQLGDRLRRDEEARLDVQDDMVSDDEGYFFHKASQSSRRQRFRALLLVAVAFYLVHAYLLPLWTSVPVELTPNGLRPMQPVRHPHIGPCPHAQNREHISGYMRNAQLALSQAKDMQTLAKMNLDPSVIEKVFENIFLSVPTAEGAKEALRGLTAVTHVAGTEADLSTAINVMEQWGQLLGAHVPDNSSEAVFDAGSPESVQRMTSTRQSGSDERHRQLDRAHPLGQPQVWIDTYSVWLNYPVSSSLTLAKANETSRPYFQASLKEDVLSQDPTSPDGLPTFHGYSKSGEVTGRVVYAALCTKGDFDRLAELGVSVKGAITLCRYGGPFRGLKVRLSAEHGAVGTLIYSDPREDGNMTSKNGHEAYPNGPARNPSSVQRGSVQAISIYPGDASTPGKPSYRNATRLDPEDTDALPKIPSLPISYQDALPFLQAVSGRGHKASDVGKGWEGAVPGVEEYWTGPSDDIVRLNNQMTDYSKPKDIWNTYAKIPGVIEDELVIVSNHRDAWTFGAGDPSSGTATIHEVVAGLGALVKRGWRPLRTILIASWDAEEYGLIGSTEAAEDYPEFFKEKASVFLNLDMAVSGSKASARSSPSLVDLIVNAAADVADPSGNGSAIALKSPGALGSGSDYTAYLQNLGIASADVGFTQGPTDPIYHYHSNYDSFHWMEQFGDPTFSRHHAMAQWMGLVTLRSAQGIFLPLNVTNYAGALHAYLKKVEKIAPKHLDLSELSNVIKKINKRATAFEKERSMVGEQIKKILSHHGMLSHRKPSPELGQLFAQVRSLNKRAQSFESSFLSKDGKGLSERPFYQHLGVAPGRYLGYGATTFPGLTESITLDGGKGTKAELKRLVDVLHEVEKSLTHE